MNPDLHPSPFTDWGQAHRSRPHCITSYTRTHAQGEWKAGKRDGHGTHTESFAPDGDGDAGSDGGTTQTQTQTQTESYEGQWRADQWHGSGTHRSAGGHTREGEWRGGLLEGQGAHRYPNGDVFEGEVLTSLAWAKGGACCYRTATSSQVRLLYLTVWFGRRRGHAGTWLEAQTHTHHDALALGHRRQPPRCHATTMHLH